MTGPEYYRRAEQLAAKADEYLGQGEGQDTVGVWAAAAQVHATFALATAVDSPADRRAWADVARTRLSDQGPEPGHDIRQNRRPGVSTARSLRPCR
jgi:hypothetical protein